MAAPMAALADAPGLAPYEQELAAAKSSIMVRPQDAYAHAQTALKQLRASKDGGGAKVAVATATWLSGEALTQMRRPDRALPLLQSAFQDISASAPQSLLMGDILMSRARAEAAIGAVQPALQDFQTAFNVFGRVEDRRGQAKALQEIGSIYLRGRDYNRAIVYYDNAQDYSGNNPALRLSINNNMGAALKELHRYKDSELAFSLALAAAKRLHSYYKQAHILTNIALAELLQHRPAAARFTIEQGLAISAAYPEARAERPFLRSVLANILADSGDYRGAGRILDKAFAEAPLQTVSSEWRDAHDLAARVYEHLGQPERALSHYKIFKRLNDEDTAVAASTEAALMGAKFDFANQKTKIIQLQAAALKRDVAFAQARARSTIEISAIVLLGGALMVGLLLHSLIAMRKSRNKISSVNDELAASNRALEKALNARTEFLAMTSHEIRTPLNGILGMTQVMLSEPGIPSETRNRLDIIKASGVAMNELLTDLLDIAKIEKGHLTVEKTELDLKAFLGDIVGMWSDKAKTKGLAFEADLSACPGSVIQDGVMLRQVLTNLLSNAIKFTSEGGVKLAVTTVGAEPDERLVLTISDSGIGIPQGQHGRVFEAFTQVDSGTSRHYGGTGLGLAICKNLIETLGGRITLTSEVGVGSTFLVDLPLVRATTPPKEDDLAAEGLERASILIFEDNPMAQAMFRSLLKERASRLDFSSALAGGTDHGGPAPDLALVDGAFIQRRAPENPMGAVAALREAFADVPIVLLWPGLTDADASQFHAMGIALALSKPITGPRLIAALEEAYRRQATQLSSLGSPGFGPSLADVTPPSLRAGESSR